MKLTPPRILSVVSVMAAAVLGGCTAQVAPPLPPDFVPQRFDLPAQGDAETPAAALDERWWRHFDDPQLDTLIETAELGNLDLRQAWHRLAAARAELRSAGGERWPALDASADAARRMTKIEGADRSYANTFALGLAASYELDLWGRVAAGVQAAEFDALASAEDLRTQALTLSAEIARNWYQLRRLSGELALLDAQAKLNSDQLEVITLRFERGLVQAADVLQQRQLLESTRGERVGVASELAVTRNALKVLLGGGEVDLGEIPADVPDLHAMPAVEAPARLLQRRPDVRQAYLEVQAADQRLAAAIAKRFPRLSLSASLRSEQGRVSDLFENWIASIAGGLSAPLIDGGTLRAEAQAAQARAAESFAAYGARVLAALSEVQDALVQERLQAEYIRSLNEQLDLSRQAVERIRDNYLKGNENFDFSRLLNAQISHQQLQRTALRARQTLVDYRIDLCRALAGGWTPPAPAPDAPRVTGPLLGLLDASSEASSTTAESH